MLIILINLARRADRLAGMQLQFARLGLAYERMAAIDGLSLPTPDGSPGIALTRGEVACHRSHRACWQRLLASSEPHALILEDDVVLSPRIEDFLAHPEVMPDGADIVRLETRRQVARLSARQIRVPSGVRMHRLLRQQDGAAGYIISRSCARRLLSEDRSADMPVDWLLFGSERLAHGGLEVYQADPALCVQGEIIFAGAIPPMMISDLEPDRRLRYMRLHAVTPPVARPNGLHRLVRQAKRLVRPAYRSLVFGDRDRRIEFDADAAAARAMIERAPV